jgi:hypothetical protein
VARIRTIKPEMPSDEALSTVSRDARLTFVLLITQADDDGLVLASPRQLLGALFPHDDNVTEAQILGWCNELATLGCVRWRRTRGGSPVLELVNWHSHQKIKHRAKPVIALTLEPLADADPVALPASHRTLRKLSGDSQEDERSVSSTNQQPATMDHGPTTDHGPWSSNQQPTTVAGAAVLLATAVNAGIEARYGEQPLAIRHSHPGSHKCAEALLAAGVDLEFAHAVIFAYASSLTLDRPPRSLGYFTQHVLDRWESEQERQRAATYRPNADVVRVPEVDQMRAFAIQYARGGNAEWQSYCDDRGIDWREVA